MKWQIALLGLLAVAGCTAAPSASTTPRPEPPVTTGRQVAVYYMHGTFRCQKCNEMERMVHDVLAVDFSKELAAGTVAWKTANYQELPDLASRYGVSSSSVVVVSFADGQESGHQRLDTLWGLRGDREALGRALAEAIDGFRGDARP